MVKYLRFGGEISDFDGQAMLSHLVPVFFLF